jgi:hypothetical protein
MNRTLQSQPILEDRIVKKTCLLLVATLVLATGVANASIVADGGILTGNSWGQAFTSTDGPHTGTWDFGRKIQVSNPEIWDPNHGNHGDWVNYNKLETLLPVTSIPTAQWTMDTTHSDKLIAKAPSGFVGTSVSFTVWFSAGDVPPTQDVRFDFLSYGRKHDGGWEFDEDNQVRVTYDASEAAWLFNYEECKPLYVLNQELGEAEGAVPEPASLIVWSLLGTAGAAVAIRSRKRRGWSEENRQAIYGAINRS